MLAPEKNVIFAVSNVRELGCESGSISEQPKNAFLDSEEQPEDTKSNGEAGLKTEETSTTTSIRRTMPIKRAYFNFFLANVLMFAENGSFFLLAAVQTSFHGLLGSVSLGVQWVTWAVFNLLAPFIFDLIGLKVSSILGSVIFLLYVLANFYPTWYTLLPTNFLAGITTALLFVGITTYSNENATTVGCSKSGDVDKKIRKYISIFQGTMLFSIRFGAAIGNTMSSILLLMDTKFQNATVEVNATTICNLKVSMVAVSQETYYKVIGVATVLGVILLITSFFLPNDFNVGLWKSKRKVMSNLKNQVKVMLRLMRQVKYLLPLTGGLLSGLSSGFFLGSFSKNFVSECIGIGYVGITVIVWSIFSFTNNIVLGQITPFISRTAPALLVSLIYITMCLFLVFWKRQPSFVVVFIATASFGVADSFWMLAPLSEYNLAHLSYLVYLGITGNKEKVATESFSLFWTGVAFGGSVNFFIASTIPVDVNLWILVVLTTVTLLSYIVVEAFHGEKLCRKFT